MKLARVSEADGPGPRGFSAEVLLEGDQSSVRTIRVAAGAEELRVRNVGSRELMLLAVLAPA